MAAPLLPTALAPARVELEERADGAILLASPEPLGAAPRTLLDWLEGWAGRAPDRVFLAERAGEGWRRLTYAQAWAETRQRAAGLLARGLSPERPLLILSGNGIEHALLALAAMLAGIPYCPVSPAYSLLSADLSSLRHIAGLIAPGLVFADDARRFARALAVPELADAGKLAPAATIERPGVAPLDGLGREPDAALDAAAAAVGPGTVAKVLFTSGSTGMPKGVITTQGMLTANQVMVAQAFRFLGHPPPVIVDWLPWNHTFGSSHNFNLVLVHGGTLYIDDGRPTPELIHRSVRNLREIGQTMAFNVPRGFEMLLPHLEADKTLRERYFGELQALFYAGAALPQNLWERLEALALQVRGARVPFVSGWGATETAPAAAVVHYPTEEAGIIGLPLPGVSLKLVPAGPTHEIRVRGPIVTPGYWRDAEATARAFDEEGYFRTGDAVRFVDRARPALGLRFDGRLAEDFKLSTGSWVRVGALRVAAIAALDPVAADVVVCGENGAEVGILVFPSLAGVARVAGEGGALGAAALRAYVAERLTRLAGREAGSSMRIARALLLDKPPELDRGEITDKGYLNQRAVRERRAPEIRRLFSDDPAVIRLAG